MSTALFIVQTLNGLQLGVLLFLIAAGLTLVFGVMDFINLAHGVQYMLGAYLAVMFYALTGSFLFALILALGAALLFGLLLEFVVFRHLYGRDHLDHVIATFRIILFLNQGVKLVVDPMSYQYLMGAEIDYREDIQGAQFVIRNPNATTTCGCGSSFSV